MADDKTVVITTIAYEDQRLYVCQINYDKWWYFIGPEKIVRHSEKSFHYDTLKFEQLPDRVQREYLLWRMAQRTLHS